MSLRPNATNSVRPVVIDDQSRLRDVLRAGYAVAAPPLARLTFSIDAPKVKRPPLDVKSFDFDRWWAEDFDDLKFAENYDALEKLRARAMREDKYLWDLVKEEGLVDMHWWPTYNERKYAEELDKKKEEVVGLFKELQDASTKEVFEKLVGIVNGIAEDMDFLKRDPYAQLWRPMRDAMQDALESNPSLPFEFFDDPDMADAAMSGDALAQHGYFGEKKLKAKKGKSRMKRR